MGPTKGRRVRKTEVSTDSVPEFELGDIEADIQLGDTLNQGGSGTKSCKNRQK